MAYNKVIYGGKTLIDLSSDTVSPETLLRGCTAHEANGTIVTGTMFSGYPSEYVLDEAIQDSSGRNLQDKSGNVIQCRIVYKKA